MSQAKIFPYLQEEAPIVANGTNYNPTPIGHFSHAASQPEPVHQALEPQRDHRDDRRR